MRGGNIGAKVNTGGEGGAWTWEEEEGGGLLERQEEVGESGGAGEIRAGGGRGWIHEAGSPQGAGDRLL